MLRAWLCTPAAEEAKTGFVRLGTISPTVSVVWRFKLLPTSERR
jgi:hypothetical protein